MDNDLDVKGAFDRLYGIISNIMADELSAGEASRIIKTLREIDEVFISPYPSLPKRGIFASMMKMWHYS